MAHTCERCDDGTPADVQTDDGELLCDDCHGLVTDGGRQLSAGGGF
jgi:hypothetical protein